MSNLHGPRNLNRLELITWNDGREQETEEAMENAGDATDIESVEDANQDLTQRSVSSLGSRVLDAAHSDNDGTENVFEVRSMHSDDQNADTSMFSAGSIPSMSEEMEVGIPSAGSPVEAFSGQDTESEMSGDIILSDDYDILQGPQTLTFRNLLEDLDSESEDETPSPAAPSPSYEPSLLAQRSRSPSTTPSFESIVQEGGQDTIPPPLHLALGLWFEKSGCSRSDYVRLREVLQLSKPSTDDGEEEIGSIQTLPLKLDTLKRQVRRHIPLLRLLRKALTVTIEKQPSMAERQKGVRERVQIERLAWQYWYDPVDLISMMLSAPRLREKMFFGMAEYVDEPTELWHSPAWGSSIRATSGDFCHTTEGDVIIPGDLLQVEDVGQWTSGRVIFIGRDHRTDAVEVDEVIVTLQKIVGFSDPILDDFAGISAEDPNEFFLVEDRQIELSLRHLSHHIEIHIDRSFVDEDEEITYNFQCIRRVLTWRTRSVRPVRYMHQTRGELEVEYFGREHLAEAFDTSLPYLLFIDDFGIHRNMYRALKAFYLIPACLSYEERRKVANVFTLTLGPHGATIDAVVEGFGRSIRQMDRGLEMMINKGIERVCAFNMAFLGDMPQQADNGGFLRHNANLGCRTCLCPKLERGNLSYDIVENGRYHWETTKQREVAKSLSHKEQKMFVRETGIRIQSPAVMRLAPCLDLIRSCAYDAPHSEWQGLGRILQSFLLTTVLNKKGSASYLKVFQTMRFPPGWPRIQSPTFYIWSWSLSEAGRASVLIPLILRRYATARWFQFAYLQTAGRVFGHDVTAVRAITKAFGVIAHANTLVGSQRHTYHARLHQVIVNSRQAYQSLITCAMQTAGAAGAFRRDISEASDQSEGEINEGADEEVNDEGSVLLEVLSAAENSENSEARGVENDPPGQRGRKSKEDKFRKLLALPNVHAGLHLADMAHEYGTVMNLSVLAGELKHKNFKRMADQAAPSNLMGYLFSRDAITQSLRLGLAGAWNVTHPEITEALGLVDTHCPALAESFLPVGEHDLDEGNDGMHVVTGDGEHRLAQMSLAGFQLSGELQITPKARLMRLSMQHPFVQGLMDAYERCYGLRVLNFGHRNLRWYRRVAFTDPTNRRHVYNVGDYIRVGDEKAHFAQGFLHTYRGIRYGFLVVNVVQPCFEDDNPLEYLTDPILNLPVHIHTSMQRIYGLWEISHQSIYMIEAPAEPDWQTEEGHRYLLECNWGVDYL